MIASTRLGYSAAGGEWEVLYSAPLSVLRSIRRIEFEYHEVHARFGYSPGKLFDHPEGAGYKLTHRHEDKNHTGIATSSKQLGPARDRDGPTDLLVAAFLEEGLIPESAPLFFLARVAA